MTASAVAKALDLVAPAENAFKSRWRFSTLEKIDPDLAQAVREQDALYDSAMLMGTDAEVREQSEAMVRGWRAACQRMEQPLQPDDSYQVGFCSKTGTRVVISDCKAAMARAQSLEMYGGVVPAIFVTPDEVAAMVAGLGVITKIKSVFPDSEFVGIEDE